jgi:alkylation response protein AidB-like acyl-CoA dehydrogenase|tara:strand:+ start:294 stop:1367 length:1074 start_codon:yes stop_codon:yes gene_type:complete
MELKLSPDESDFQREIGKFVDRAFPIAIRERPSAADEAYWHRAVANEGWTAVEWPVEFGGPGWNPIQIYLWYRVILQANCPVADYCGLQLVGPLLQRFGGRSDTSQHLEGIRKHTHVWGNAVFFDASATVLATGAGENFLLHGETPCFSTSVKFDRALVLAKTHNAYSLFLVDLNLAGIALTQTKSAPDIFSLAFDQVQIEALGLVGEIDKGIDHLIYLVTSFESIAIVVHLQVALSNLRRLTALKGMEASMEKRLADLEIELKALEATGLRSILSAGREKLPIVSIKGRSLAGRIRDSFIDVLGYYSLPYETGVEGSNEPVLTSPDFQPNFRQLEYLPGCPQDFRQDLVAKTLLGL